jgi:hypothetical protein
MSSNRTAHLYKRIKYTSALEEKLKESNAPLSLIHVIEQRTRAAFATLASIVQLAFLIQQVWRCICIIYRLCVCTCVCAWERVWRQFLVCILLLLKIVRVCILLLCFFSNTLQPKQTNRHKQNINTHSPSRVAMCRELLKPSQLAEYVGLCWFGKCYNILSCWHPTLSYHLFSRSLVLLILTPAALLYVPVTGYSHVITGNSVLADSFAVEVMQWKSLAELHLAAFVPRDPRMVKATATALWEPIAMGTFSCRWTA